MKRIRAAIIDDEQKLREVLKLKLHRVCPDIQVVCEADNARSGFDLINKERPDIVFLDISMPKGSGFDLLARFEKIDFQLIFVTGFNEYALQALKMSAVDYLLKPIIDQELELAVTKAKERISSEKDLEEFELLKHNISEIDVQTTKLSIPSMNSYEQVQVSSVIRVEGEQRYTRVYMVEDFEILSSYSIGKFKDMLSRFTFIDCHKSHLVNSLHVVRYMSDGLIIMSDGSSIPVSRRKREDIKQQLLLLMKERH